MRENQQNSSRNSGMAAGCIEGEENSSIKTIWVAWSRGRWIGKRLKIFFSILVYVVEHKLGRAILEHLLKVSYRGFLWHRLNWLSQSGIQSNIERHLCRDFHFREIWKREEGPWRKCSIAVGRKQLIFISVNIRIVLDRDGNCEDAFSYCMFPSTFVNVLSLLLRSLLVLPCILGISFQARGCYGPEPSLGPFKFWKFCWWCPPWLFVSL